MRWRLIACLSWFIASVIITGLCHGCIPASKKLTGPLACPAGTAEYVVWRHWERTGSSNKTSETSDLICIDADGGGASAGTLRPFAVGFLYIGTLLAIPFGLVLLAGGRRKGKGGVTSTVGLLALVMLTGCPWGTVSSDELDKRYPYHQGRLFSRGVLEGVVHQLEARVGAPVTVTGLNVSPGAATFSVRDARHPENVDTWSYRDGDFTSTPQRTEGQQNLDEQSFPLAGLPFGKVRDMVGAAIGKLHMQDARATSVSFNRYPDGVRIYIDVESPRQRGRAHFDMRGELVNAEVE